MKKNLPIKEIMRTELITVGPNTKVSSVAKLMLRKNVGSVLVRRREVIEGIVTERDIISKVVSKDKKPSEVCVKDIMNRYLICGNPEMDITEAAKLMAEKGIRRLPIMENETLVGIISEMDILKVSPTLIEITREFRRIKNIEEPHEEWAYCEECGTYTDEPVTVDGRVLCRYCAER